MADSLFSRGLRPSNVLDHAVAPDPRLDPAVVSVAGRGEFARGLRSTRSGLSASAMASEGLDAEIAGDASRASQLYQQAAFEHDRAASVAPRVTSLKDIHGVGDAADFIAGQAPQALVTTAPVVAGALVGRGLLGKAGTFAGAAVPAYNMEYNEAAGAMAMDPQTRARLTPEQIKGLARVKGGINTALESVGPGAAVELALARDATRPTLRGIARNLGAQTLGEAATEGTQEIVGQAAQSYGQTGDLTKNIDWQQVQDAAAGGAVGGAGLGAPAAGIHGAQIVAGRAQDRAAQAAGAVQDVGGQVLGKATPVFDQLKSAVAQRLDHGWLGGKDDVPPDVLAQGAPAVMDYLDQQDTQRKEAVVQRLGDSVDLSTPEAMNAAVEQVAAKDRGTTISGRLSDFAERASSFAKGFMNGKKSNEQFTATQRLALDTMASHTTPEVAQSEGFQTAVPFIVNALTGYDYHPSIRRAAAREMFELYGEQAPAVATQVAEIAARGGANVNPERVGAEVQSLLKDEMQRGKLGVDVVKNNLSNEGVAALTDSLGVAPDERVYSKLAEVMQRQIESGGKGSDELKALFGDKLGRVENFFKAVHENDAKRQSALVAGEEHASGEDTSPVYHDEASYEERQAMKAMGKADFVRKGKNVTLFDKAFPAAIDERIASETTKNPDMVFEKVPALQYAQEAGIDPAQLAEQVTGKKVAPEDVASALAGKTAIRVSPSTDDQEATVLAPKDLERLNRGADNARQLKAGEQPKEGERTFVKSGKRYAAGEGRASEGIIHFEREDGGTYSVNADKLIYEMRGREQKSGGVGSENQLDLLLSGISSALSVPGVKGAYTINSRGERRPLTGGKMPAALVFGGRTAREQKQTRDYVVKKKRDAGLAEKVKAAQAKLDANPKLLKIVRGELTTDAELAAFAKNPALFMAREEEKMAGIFEKNDTDISSEVPDGQAAQNDADFERVQAETRMLTKSGKSTTPSTEAERAGAKKTVELTNEEKLAKMKKAVSNEQRTNGVASDEDVAAAKDYVAKTLGAQFKTEFVKNLGGKSGEWEQGDTENVIRIALNAGPGVLSVAHHEAMHEFFSRLTKSGRSDVQEVLLNAANSPVVQRQLERLLAKEPGALRQIKNDAEERLAYMYQFWAAGGLTVGPKTEGVFTRIAKFLRKVTGMLAGDERAEAILAAFHSGKLAEPSAAAEALNEIMQRGQTAQGAIDAIKPIYQKAAAFVQPSHDVLAKADNPFANEIGKQMYTELSGKNVEKFGYLNAIRAKSAEWENRFTDAVAGLSKEELALAREALSTKTPTTFAPAQAAAEKVKALLRDFREYAVGRGVEMGKREDYFPRVWDFQKISEDRQGFIDMLVKNYPSNVTEETAAHIADTMGQLSGVEQEGKLKEEADEAGYTPFMQAVNRMKLNFVQDKHAQQYLNDDIVEIVTSYLRQGVRRAEYQARFGEGGEQLNELLDKAHEYELAAVKKAQPKLSDEEAGKKAMAVSQRYADAVHAMEGTLGHDQITPAWRKFNSWMVAYQNLRLLPLQLFSSMIDPLGLIVRGGTLDDGLKAFQRGVRDVVGQWTGKEHHDEAMKLAEMLGTIEHRSLLDTMGYAQESIYANRSAKKLSDWLFRVNGMEAWNRAMRTQATVAATEFIKENGSNPGEHSERWLGEMGLTKNDVKLSNDGQLVVNRQGFEALGMSRDEATKAAEKMQFAVNQWVDGAMLRPNAALRPSWSSDPRWSLFFYLKQFTYAFHKTFLARVRNEYKHGNAMPMVAMLPFVPTMIATDVIRGVLQNGGELPQYMKGWSVGDYLMHGVQRAGLLGVGQLGVDELHHGADMLGPVVQQGIDVFTQPVGDTVHESIPGLALMKSHGREVMAD